MVKENKELVLVPELVYSNVMEFVEGLKDPFKFNALYNYKKFVKSVQFVIKSKSNNKVRIPIRETKDLLETILDFIVKKKKLTLTVDYSELFKLTIAYVMFTLKIYKPMQLRDFFHKYINLIDHYLTNNDIMGVVLESEVDFNINTYGLVEYTNVFYVESYLANIYEALKNQIRDEGDIFVVDEVLYYNFTFISEYFRKMLHEGYEYRDFFVSYYIVENIKGDKR